MADWASVTDDELAGYAAYSQARVRAYAVWGPNTEPPDAEDRAALAEWKRRQEAPYFEAPVISAAYSPDMTNIGGYVVDANGNQFEIEDETSDGRHVVITTGRGQETIDLAEGWRVEEG